jgi:peptidoglycan/LPS O-acetylase OafA/YrhL
MTSYPVAAILGGASATYLVATIIASGVARLGFPLPPEKRRIGCLDGLRGYLALSVFIHHFIIWLQVTRLGGSWRPPSINLFNQFGDGGVALFFMITGTLFYPRVLAGFRACSWSATYITRAFRIVPLVVFSVAVITAIIAARTGRGLDRAYPVAAAKWISTWGEPPLLGYPDSAILNAGVLWSLSYEWLFYLFVLPACALTRDLTRGKLQSWAMPPALLCFSFTAQAFQISIPLLTVLPHFAIGMLAYEIQQREDIARLFRTPLMTAIGLAALAIGAIAFPTAYSFPALPLFAVFFVSVACGNDFGGLLKVKGALVLGECSYGIYLLHGTLLSLWFVDASGLTSSLATPLAPILLPFVVAPVVLAASVTFLAVERPGIRIGYRVAAHWRTRRVPGQRRGTQSTLWGASRPGLGRASGRRCPASAPIFPEPPDAWPPRG